MALSSQILPEVSCQFVDLGLMDYSKAYAIQQKKIQEVLSTHVHQLLLCEHPPVFTLGRVSREDNFIFPRFEIEKSGVPVIAVDRGGEITFHGPGQLVIYPIFELKSLGGDLKLFMHMLEDVAMDALKVFGITANRIPGQRGIFVHKDKIGSIGIGIKKWVSFHGMSLNVNTDLRYSQMIRPCGLDVAMTSMQHILGKTIDMALVKAEIIRSFEREFHLNIDQGGNEHGLSGTSGIG